MKRVIVVMLACLFLAGCSEKAKVFNGGEWHLGEYYKATIEFKLDEVEQSSYSGKIKLHGEAEGMTVWLPAHGKNIHIEKIER